MIYKAEMRLLLGSLLALSGLLAPERSSALTLFTAGKVGVFRTPAGGEAEAIVRVGRDRALATLPALGCPTVSTLRFALSRRGADFEDHGEIPLPCEHWRPKGDGWRFRAPAGGAGGVREIVVGPRRLVIRAGGPEFVGLAGPVSRQARVGEQRAVVWKLR